MKKPTIHKKLSLQQIQKKHKTNTMDKELNKVIEGNTDDGLKEKFNSLLKKAFKPLKP